MPACPSCGSSDAFQIAPNYFRCMGLVPPFSDAEPGEYVRCDYEFQAGGLTVTSAQPVCACGTFAVGRCHTCQRSVCGEHSAMFEGRRLCADHHYEALAPQRAMEAKREQERSATWARESAERQEFRERAEAEEARRKQWRARLNVFQALVLVAIPVVVYLYLDGQGVSGVLNMVLTGGVVGFLSLAAMTANSSHSYQGKDLGRWGYDADAFWIGILGIPLGAALGGILALIV